MKRIFNLKKETGKKGTIENLSEIDAAQQVPLPPMTMAESLKIPSRYTDTVHSSMPWNIYSPCSSVVVDQDRTYCNLSCLC